MEKIMINEWGAQVRAYLTSWKEIRKRGFLPCDRSFGTTNDGKPCLYFCNRYLFDKRFPAGIARKDRKHINNRLYITLETLEDVMAIEGRA